MSESAASNQGKGIVLMLIAMFCIASNDAIGKNLTQDFSIWQVLWLRSLVWVVCAFAWIACNGGLKAALPSRRPILQIVRSLVLVAEICVFIIAFKHLPLGDVTAVSAGTPLVVLVLAALFLNERVGIHRWSAVAIGFIGMLLIARPGFGVLGLMSLLPLLGALLFGIYQVLVRLVGRVDNPQTTLLWSGIALFIVTSCITPWYWRPVEDMHTWGLFVFVGILNTTGHFGIIAALHHAQASALQPFTYSIVIWALIIGWFMFAEIPDSKTVMGIMLVVASGLYAVHREIRQARLARTHKSHERSVL